MGSQRQQSSPGFPLCEKGEMNGPGALFCFLPQDPIIVQLPMFPLGVASNHQTCELASVELTLPGLESSAVGEPAVIAFS